MSICAGAQPDECLRDADAGQLRGRIQENSQPSPAARVVVGLDPYALTVVALMGAAVREGKSCPGLPRIVVHGGGCGYIQALHGLTRDLGDEIEVLIEVQHGESGEFSSRGDDQVRY
jgi:hypothetical protein